MLTMAIHPVSRGVLTLEQVERMAVISAIAHTLAMFSFLAIFLGTCGLTRYLAARETPDRSDRLAFGAVVTFGFACVAVLIATAISGFIVPNIMRHMVRDIPTNAPQYHLIIDSMFQINQAFSLIFSVATSAAILLWSASGLRHGGLGRGIAIYGCVISPVLTVLLGVGHLRLNVHGMAIVVLAHAIWFIAVGAELVWRQPPGQAGMAHR